MPLVQIDLPHALFVEKGREIGVELQAAFADTTSVPLNDRFQIFRPRNAGEIVFDPTYGDVDRRNLMIIQVLMVHQYPVDQKRDLYRAMVNRLAKLGIRKEDIFIALHENSFEDWYAGRLYGE
jgi:hypothetical protein